MRIAITGHSAGIGLALADEYTNLGHEIVGLSRRNGYNIRNLTKILHPIIDCDVFINNAQAGFAQTELLAAVWKEWRNQADKLIINISTLMTTHLHADYDYDMEIYRIQKLALENTHHRLRSMEGSPRMILVKPGAVATQPGQQDNLAFCDVVAWAKRFVNIIDFDGNIQVSEFSLQGKN